SSILPTILPAMKGRRSNVLVDDGRMGAEHNGGRLDAKSGFAEYMHGPAGPCWQHSARNSVDLRPRGALHVGVRRNRCEGEGARGLGGILRFDNCLRTTARVD